MAQAAARRGAEVILISGPVNLSTPYGVRRIDVESALQCGRESPLGVDGERGAAHQRRNGVHPLLIRALRRHSGDHFDDHGGEAIHVGPTIDLA